jgi:hypothetical protein
MDRYLYPPPPVETLPELDELWTRQEGFMIVRHPFVRLVSAYEVMDVSFIFLRNCGMSSNQVSKV